jgi:SpoVK/Ycf46/Vps4 family AAA+-type ATPase
LAKAKSFSEKQEEQELTPEEKETTSRIAVLLKENDLDGAIGLIRNLIATSKNGDLVRQYAHLLNRLTQPPKKGESSLSNPQFVITVEKPKTTFKDVKGMYALKKKIIREVILMLKGRESYLRHRLKPSGMLLYGPPGTGKTFLMEAMAGEYGMSMIRPDLATLFSQWVGETEKNISKMVSLAIQNQPCIIVVDEVDSKIRNRANIEARGESAVNLGATTQFLETMQKVHNENNQVIFTAATNRIWDVDPAAKRPGRLGDLIYVPSPSLKDRFILFVHYLKSVKNKRISPFGYLRLSMATARYSPADIEEICIQTKKDMLYKNITQSEQYYSQKFTREQYTEALAAGTLPHKPEENLSTKDVIRVIRKNFKNSSLDAWYVEANKALLGWEETVVEKQKGFLLTRTFKKKVKHEGSITKDEQKLYKDMIKDIKRAIHRAWWTRMIRMIARWSI